MGSAVGATTIADLALRTRKDAEEVVARHKKLASFRLYSILAPCLELCERCQLSASEYDELKALFNSQPRYGNRRYIERGSDIYQLVCRFVFTETNRTNAARYAQALRMAASKQIRSSMLEQWLRQNGGVNALYFSRPLKSRSVSTKTLRLDRAITIPRAEQFTLVLTLQWQTDNTFRIVKEEHE